MEDLSYFQEPVEVLVTEETKHFDEVTLDWVVSSPAVYETQMITRKKCQNITTLDLERTISKKITDGRLDQKIRLQQETIQWDWYQKYLEYLSAKEAVDFWNMENAATFEDEEGVEYTVEPKGLPTAPVRPPIVTPEQWRKTNYTLLRQSEYGTWQEQMELLYDDQRDGTTKFKDAIDAVKLKHGKPL